MEPIQELTVLDVAAKCRSKKELYSVLTTEGDLYLPPLADWNQNYLWGIWNGDKLYIKWSEVKVIKVPHFEGLQIKKILAFAFEHFDVQQYIPDYEYRKEPNRDWICSLVHTLIQDEFKEFVAEKLSHREEKIIKEKNLGVTARPEIINIFKKYKAVSTSKGKSHFLLRPVARRNDNIGRLNEEEKAEENARIINDLKDKLDEMKTQITKYERDQEEAFVNKEKLVKLYDRGIIDSDGEYNEH